MPFMNSSVYEGPLASSMGGADISWLVGLVFGALAYYGYAVRVRSTGGGTDADADTPAPAGSASPSPTPGTSAPSA